MTEKGIDIFHELKKLQFTNISKVGKEQQKVLGKRTIQGFLEQKALREELSKKIALSLVSSKSASNIEEEMNKISKESDVVFNDGNEHKNNIMNNEYQTKNTKKEFTKYIRLLQKQHKELIRDNNNKHNNKYNRNTKPVLRKNYPVNYELIKQLKKQRHKVPESCAYHPNYNAISPHVPYVKLQPLKEKNIKLNSSMDCKENDSVVVQSQGSVVDMMEGSFKRNNVIPFEKYSPRTDIVRKDVNKDRIVLEPIKVKKKVSVPNFKKMLSRNKSVFNVLGRIESLVDYTPNYKAVHYNAMGYNKGDINLYHKKVLVKRIWTSFDASAEYVVVPKLNEIS